MAVFIQKGDTPMEARQARKRGFHLKALELGPDREALMVAVPDVELPAQARMALSALGHETYADYAMAWAIDNMVNETNNVFNWTLMRYAGAVTRLAQYRLSAGLPEVTEIIDGEEVVTQEAIPALPTEIEQTSTNPETGEVTTVMVPNPPVVKDEAEREVAEETVINTPQDVKDFYASQQ